MMNNAKELLLELMLEKGAGSTSIKGRYAKWRFDEDFAFIDYMGHDVSKFRCVFDVSGDGNPTIYTDWHPETINGLSALASEIVDILENESD